MDDIKMLGAEDLAKLLGRSAETIKADVRRRPHTLPPRFRPPGSNRLLWIEADVVAWINQFRQPVTTGVTARGRRRAA